MHGHAAADFAERQSLDTAPKGTLKDLDHIQKQALEDLKRFNLQQEFLKGKLEEQQRLLQEVQGDINNRDRLLNYVFNK